MNESTYDNMNGDMCFGSGFKYNCSSLSLNLTGIMPTRPLEDISMVHFSQMFYGYLTPIILVVGLVGNGLSLCVFLSKNLRNMSASRYLAALSMADISTLLFYVLGEWLQRGLKHISPGKQFQIIEINGICQIWLFLNYFSRFLSAWLIVCFTCERFISVCMPLRRRNLGTLKDTTKIISILTIVAALLVSYKPFLSEVRTVSDRTACTSKQDFVRESFVLDSVYGLLITLVPFLIIATLNIAIIRKLFARQKQQQHLVTEESHIRLEFTFILLVVSFFLIAFNFPFFIVWFRHFIYSSSQMTNLTFSETNSKTIEYWIGVLNITRTIFYINYCCNFFLYSITGTIFRKELRGLFYKKNYRSYDAYINANLTHDTHDFRHNSWV